jgi:ATP/maltotriose-dependent transcriptional regulator MalT
MQINLKGATRMATSIPRDRGSVWLTRREAEVLGLLFDGRSTKQVADEMFVSKRTVDYHLARIYEKLNVSNRVQALRRAAELGLFVPPVMAH